MGLESPVGTTSCESGCVYLALRHQNRAGRNTCSHVYMWASERRMVQSKGDKAIHALNSSVIIFWDLQPHGALAPVCRMLPASQSAMKQNLHRARSWHPLIYVLNSIYPESWLYSMGRSWEVHNGCLFHPPPLFSVISHQKKKWRNLNSDCGACSSQPLVCGVSGGIFLKKPGIILQWKTSNCL